jgi:hypothetical protein
LFRAAGKYHFGVFILTPDDVTTSRDKTEFSARDNVLFEYGIFLGALGPDRTLALIERGDEKMKVPSDLLGIQIKPFTYTSKDNLKSQIRPALNQFRETITQLGPSSFSLRGGWGFDEKKTHKFVMQVSSLKLNEYREKIGSRKLLLVIRKHDPVISDQHDDKIVMGTPRGVGKTEQEVMLEAGSPNCLGELKKNDKINAFLYLVPESANISQCDTMKKLEDSGCVLLDHEFGVTIEEPSRKQRKVSR